MNTKEGYVNVTGGKIWYKISSPEINNVPLLIIHGGPGATHDIFEPLEKIFNKRPRIFYDQLGSGNSTDQMTTSYGISTVLLMNLKH